MLSFLEYLVFFGGFLLQKTTVNNFRMDFDMFFGILIFEPKRDFAWAIAFACMMADFENALISRIFSVFWSGFLQRTTVNDL